MPCPSLMPPPPAALPVAGKPDRAVPMEAGASGSAADRPPLDHMVNAFDSEARLWTRLSLSGLGTVGRFIGSFHPVHLAQTHTHALACTPGRSAWGSKGGTTIAAARARFARVARSVSVPYLAFSRLLRSRFYCQRVSTCNASAMSLLSAAGPVLPTLCEPQPRRDPQADRACRARSVDRRVDPQE